jgi:putative methionine-R-sulfoxide reductase with GAF domain
MSKSEIPPTRKAMKIKPYFKLNLKRNLYSGRTRNKENLTQINTLPNKHSHFSPFHFKQLSQIPNYRIFECPLEMNCPYYKRLTNLENEMNKILKTNFQLSKISGLYLNSLNQKDRLYKSMIVENQKLKNNIFEQLEKLKSQSLSEENNQLQESIISIKKRRNSLLDYEEENNNYNTNYITGSPKKRNSTKSIYHKGSKSSEKINLLLKAMSNSKSAFNQYEVINAYSNYNQKYKYKNQANLSLIANNIDFDIILKENPILQELNTMTKSDSLFIKNIEEAPKDKLINYSDAISGLIKDYKEMIKINIRLKDFIKGSNDLVDSIIRRNSSGVLLENTCRILDCERASLFIHDKITDMLIVHSGEGLKKAEIKIPKDKGIVGSCFMSGTKLKIDDVYCDARFNKEVDKKTNFRTRNILCYPLIDKSGSCFGVIEAINKKFQPFDQDDEVLLLFFSQQASAILNNASSMDENIFQINRMEILIEYILEVNNIKIKEDFFIKTLDFLMNAFECMNSQLFYINNDKIFKFDPENKIFIEKSNKLGIVGIVYKKKELNGCPNIKYSFDYNELIDINSQDGLLTFPILDNKNLKAIAQIPFHAKFTKDNQPQDNDLSLIKLFSLSFIEWIHKNEQVLVF